ncbi:MAG: PKD domain-containing protein, partial [Acidobacteriota bacterium]|nr:PKD domain-containing protein [Acidobacteriota bacterium]
IAWNGQNWLVIWEHQTKATDGVGSPVKIYGARVAPDGTVLDSPFEILEAPGYAGSMVVTAVAANGSEWLVVGQADSGGGIGGVRVAGDGTVLDAVPVTLVPDTYFLYFDASLRVAQGEYLLVYRAQSVYQARRLAPDLSLIASPIYLPTSTARVASNGTDYFVTWDPSGGTLYGSRMTVDGTLLDPAGIPIMASLWDAGDDSRVEWDGTQWWVFHGLPYPDGGLHFARITPGGTVIDSPPVFVHDTDPASFVGPYAVAGGLAGGLQLVWADQNCGGCPNPWTFGTTPWDIHGKNISVAGQIGIEKPMSNATPAQTQPDLTTGPGQFLAVFHSESGGVKRIMVQRLDNQGDTIDAEPIEIASSPYATHPAVAWNGSLYMIVWDEFFYCVGGDPPPCGNFIQAVRMLPDGTVIDAQPITVLEANHADVAALNDDFLVVGRDNYIFGEHEVVPLGVRVDGTTGTLLDTTPLILGWSFAMEPRVAALGDKWLVVYERRISHDESWGGSYFNFVAADGTVQYDKFATRGVCNGATPDVAVSGAGALVVCREKPFGHFLADINGGLILPDETASLFLISGAVEEQRSPAVTWTGTEYLVVWEDKRNGIDYFDERTDLYGARVDVFGEVLDPDGFPIATGLIPSHQPSLATMGTETLLAASIFRDAETNYRVAVYETPATPTEPAEVSFGGVPTMGCSPLSVYFSDQSVDPLTEWSWGFGDGMISTEQNPGHVYANPGTYTVHLTAADAVQGVGSSVRFDYISVDQSTVAGFSGAPTSACGPITVNFTDGSLGDPTSWLWMFGDDTFSTEQNPSHTYEYPGSYSVSLMATGACGSNTLTQVGFVDVPELCPVKLIAVEEMSVASNPVGTYQDTHPDSNSSQSLFEVGGVLDHRYRIDVGTSSEPLDFFVRMYKAATFTDDYTWEYSTDNVNFTPMATVTFSGWTTTRVPVPAGLQGSVWVRVRDNSPNPAGLISVGEVTFLRAVPPPPHAVEAVMGLEFPDRDSMQWVPSASAAQYDVMWGTLDDLRANGSIGGAQCGWEDNPATTLLEPSIPPPGVAYYYVIRGDAPQMPAGTLDNVPGMTPPEGRDQEVGTAGGSSCGDMP